MYLTPLLGMTHSVFTNINHWCDKTEVIFSDFNRTPTCDIQTDGRQQAIAYSAACICAEYVDERVLAVNVHDINCCLMSYLSNDDCLEVRRENNQNCSLLCCI